MNVTKASFQNKIISMMNINVVYSFFEGHTDTKILEYKVEI